MGLLAPFFLIGLAGLAVPVAIHLTRRERGKPVRFPSLMFVEHVPFRERSRRRIRHWALLVLRLAAIVLLATAFSRPFVRGGGLATAGAAGPEEVVILLDQSYSMALADHWSQAVSRARDAALALRPQDRVSLAAFAESPSLVARSSVAAAPVLRALDTLETTALGTRMAPALKLAGAVLDASPLVRRRVVLVSDFQRVGWQPDRDAVLPEGVALETVVVGDEGAGAENLAIGGLELQRAPGQGRDRVSVRARVVSLGGRGGGAGPASGAGASASGASGPVGLVGQVGSLGAPAPGGPAARQLETRVVLSVDGTEVETVGVSVPMGGAAQVSFGAFTLGHDFTKGILRVEDDALAADNMVHFVASPGAGVDVLIWDPRGTGPSNLHLRRALEAGGPAGFSVGVTASAPSAEELDAADLVAMTGAAVVGGASLVRLTDFVAAGGGLLVVLGETGPVGGGRRGGGRAELLPVTLGQADAPPDPRRLGFVDYDHPVFAAFRGPRSGDFSRTAFYRTRRIEALGGGRALARFDDGSPALVEVRLGRGRVLVWAGGMDRLWSDFPLQPVYLPFVHRVASWLGARGESAEWHVVGTTVDLAALAEAVGADGIPPDAVAMTPGGGSAPVDPAAPLLFLAKQGIWEVRPPGRRPERPLALAANVDLRESDLAKLDLAEFAVAAGGDRTGAEGEFDVGEATPEEASVQDVERRQALWRYLLAGLFLLLVSETVLANRLSRARAAA